MNEGPVDDEVRIVTAGRIIAMQPGPVRALALRGERVAATGDPGELRDRFPAASVVDLGGDVTVVPGFNDAHQHPTICAEQLLQLDLSPECVGSRAETLAALATRARSTPAGEWIVASGFDDARSYGGAELTVRDLDEACPNHPVLVTHRTLHAGVINSAALRLAGLRDDSDAPPGGELGHDAAGRLTGVLHDQALYDLAFPAFTRRRTIVPRPTTSDAERAFHRFAQRLHAAGITSVGDAMVGPDGWALLHGLDQRASLPLRVTALLAYEHVHQMHPAFDQVRESGRLRVGGVKVFADGAVNGGACWLEEPAIGVAGNGSPRMAPEQLADVVRDVHESGWRVAVHANGDRAIRVTLEAIAAAQRRHARDDARHRIEHVGVVNAQIVETMRRLGVVAVPFGQYATAHGDKLRRFYEPARTERMFAHRTLLEAGIPVAGSSDYPCGPYEPLYAMQSCVTRADRNGEPFGASQRITPAQALALYTTGSAYASAEENVKGRLAAGYLADFAVLGDDPLTVPPDRLAEIPVLQTWIGGRPVWSHRDSMVSPSGG